MTRQALSLWQSEDKQSASRSLKALSKSVCMPFRALAWPKCQINIWQNHITLFHSPSLDLSHSLCDVGLTNGLNHSDAAHGVCSFRRPSGSHMTSKIIIEWGRAGKAIAIVLYVVEPLKNILKPTDTHSCCGAYWNTNSCYWCFNRLILHFIWYIIINSDGKMAQSICHFWKKKIFCYRNTLVFCVAHHRGMKQHYPLVLLPALHNRIGFRD